MSSYEMRDVRCGFPAALRQRSAAAARSLGLAALLLQAGAALAQDPRERAVDAALADGMTTAVGVAASGGLINPLGPLLATAMKALTFERARTLPETEQPAAYAAASAMWIGGTVSNVCITAVLLTGGGLAPACLAVGAAWGLKTWQDSEHERNFWERCTILRQFAVRQDIPCVYVPPGQQVAASEAAAKPAVAKRVRGKAGPVKTAKTPALAAAPAPAAPAAAPAPPVFVSHEVEAP